VYPIRQFVKENCTLPTHTDYLDASDGDGAVVLNAEVYEKLITGLLDPAPTELSLDGTDYVAYSQAIPRTVIGISPMEGCTLSDYQEINYALFILVNSSTYYTHRDVLYLEMD